MAQKDTIIGKDDYTKHVYKTILTDGKYNVEVNSEGQLHTVMRGKADDGNSTITPLLANTTFTGTAIDTFDYSAVSIVIHSDVGSATSGLEIEYSANGTTWHEGESYTILAGATKFFTPTLQGQYLRIKYTNGTTNQTTFHMHTVLRKSPIKWSSHNIDDAIKDQDDATLTKSVITGKRTDGVYDNVSLTNGANMKVSLEEFDSAFYDSPLPIMKGFDIPKYDEIVMSYTGSDLTGVVYKLATVAVSTLTLSYTSGNLTGVVHS